MENLNDNENLSPESTGEHKKKKLLGHVGSLLLLITAIIWGLAFTAQQKGMESLGPFSFNGIRSFVAAIALSPLLVINRKKLFTVTDRNGKALDTKKKKTAILTTGLLSISIVFFLASTSQQIGIGLTDNVGKAGFITALYIVLVPVAGIFMKKKPKWIVYLCVLFATFGLYLLCIPKGSGFSIGKGDLLLIACAVLFTFHIILIDLFSARINGLVIAVSQFLAVGLLSLIGILFFEKPTFTDIKEALIPILYAGILSSGVGYTLQIFGQKYVEPTKASLIMCLESVFSVLGGFLILHQKLSLREGIGCVVMFTAIIVCQIFGNSEETKEDEKTADTVALSEDSP